MKVSSVFTVTSYKTGKQLEEVIEGSGEGAIKYLRSLYPRFTKFVLEGFEIEENGSTIFKRIQL